MLKNWLLRSEKANFFPVISLRVAQACLLENQDLDTTSQANWAGGGMRFPTMMLSPPSYGKQSSKSAKQPTGEKQFSASDKNGMGSGCLEIWIKCAEFMAITRPSIWWSFWWVCEMLGRRLIETPPLFFLCTTSPPQIPRSISHNMPPFPLRTHTREISLETHGAAASCTPAEERRSQNFQKKKAKAYIKPAVSRPGLR